jgi:hypothetical protein
MAAPGQHDPAGSSGSRPPGAREHAVKGLHSPAKPQPKPNEVPPPPADVIPESASGFVGMLAKGQFGGEGGGEAPSATLPPGGLGGAGGAAAGAGYSLRMAREIPPPAATVAAPRETAPVAVEAPVAAAPRSGQRVAPQLAIVVACLLLPIGLWAVGAIVYMNAVLPAPVSPEDVHYPLIRWSLDVGNLGGYTAGSRLVAWTMMLCLPVGGALLALSRMLGRPTSARR